MSTPLAQPRAVAPVAPRSVSRRMLLLVASAGVLLTLAGVVEMAASLPRQTVLRSLMRPGGWQRAMVAVGGRDVALRAEAAAWRSGSPAALTDGATILASLSAATGDPAIIRDLQQRSLAMATGALQQAPATAQTQFISGAVSAALDSDSPAASRHLARAASLDPHNAALRQRIGMVELDRGRLQEAATHFRVALAANFRIARPLYQALATLGSSLEAAQVTPATPRAQAALGAWLYENDEFEASEIAFIRGLAVAETEASTDESLWAYRRLYGFLISQHRFAEAESLAAVRLAAGVPNEPDARALLLHDQGVALLRLKRPEEAVPLLAEATALQPEASRYLNTYASILAAAGHPREAASAWEQALALPRRTESERNAEIPMRLARVRSLSASGQTRIALDELRRILMVRPDHAHARQLAVELAYE
jgi:tetratricopeptide (TPR) repeat protein